MGSGLVRSLSTNSAPPLPDIDFGTVTVLAAFLGDRSSCGYEVIIQRAFALEGGLTVQLNAYAPEPGFGYCAALTHPFHFASVPGRWTSVTFEWTRALSRVSFGETPPAAPLG